METLSLAAPKGYIKSKNPKRKEKKAFTHFRNVNPIYITESQYHRIAIRSPSYNIDFFAALGFPGNKYVYTLVSFFFFFHAIDRYIYIFAVGKENPSSSSKVFHSFFVCATVYFGISNGRIRFCAQRASLTLFLLCILWCHIVCGSETDSLIFLIYTIPRLHACFFICCWLYTAPGWWIVSISKRKTKNLCSSYYYIADAVGYIDRIHLRDICGRKKQ